MPRQPVPGRANPLLAAALAGDPVGLRAGMDAGSDIDAWDDLGFTPLLSAVWVGDVRAVALLLEAGADPNRHHGGEPTDTPLWRARDDFGLHEIADLLEAAGAKPVSLPNKPLQPTSGMKIEVE